MRILFYLLLASANLMAGDVLELRYVLEQQEPGAIQKPHAETMLWLAGEVVISEKDILQAGVLANDGFAVLLTLSKEGSERFDEFASKHQGDRLAILVNKKIISAPVVRERQFGGKIAISGNFSKEEAIELAKALNQKAPSP